MAYELNLESITVKAKDDLSSQTAAQYHAVKLTSTGVALCTAASDASIGVLQNKPTATHAATVGIEGVSKLYIGTGGCSIGDRLTSDSGGAGITTTVAADVVIGIALAAGSSGDIVPVLITAKATKVGA